MRVKQGDTVFHLGDWCCKGNERGAPGSPSNTKARSWELPLNGKIIHIKGNHDGNNGLKHALEYAVLKYGGLSIYLVHIPPTMLDSVPPGCNLVLCGHVHEKWKYKMLDGLPVINVGVDVWNYRPVSGVEVIEEYEKIKKLEKLKKHENRESNANAGIDQAKKFDPI